MDAEYIIEAIKEYGRAELRDEVGGALGGGDAACYAYGSYDIAVENVQKAVAVFNALDQWHDYFRGVIEDNRELIESMTANPDYTASMLELAQDRTRVERMANFAKKMLDVEPEEE